MDVMQTKQPRPRERPELEGDEGPAASTRRHRRRAVTPEPTEPLEEEPADMGIGLDERGEVDRRFEP
jgi:hypothetical protein